jgi:hypothetical protein
MIVQKVIFSYIISLRGVVTLSVVTLSVVEA